MAKIKAREEEGRGVPFGVRRWPDDERNAEIRHPQRPERSYGGS